LQKLTVTDVMFQVEVLQIFEKLMCKPKTTACRPQADEVDLVYRFLLTFSFTKVRKYES